MGVLRGIFGLSSGIKEEIAGKVAKGTEEALRKLRIQYSNAPKGSAEAKKIFKEAQNLKKQQGMKQDVMPELFKTKPKATKPKATKPKATKPKTTSYKSPPPVTVRDKLSKGEEMLQELRKQYRNAPRGSAERTKIFERAQEINKRLDKLKVTKPKTTKAEDWDVDSLKLLEDRDVDYRKLWEKKTGGRVYKKGGKSIKAGLDTLQTAHTKREPKVEKKRKESKDAYEMALLVGGSVPLVGPLTKVPKIVAKGLKAAKKSKKGMRPALKVINPTSGQLKPRPTGQLRKRKKGGSIYDKETHISQGKAGKIPHTGSFRPHSGARKRAILTNLKEREDKVRPKKAPIPKKKSKDESWMYLDAPSRKPTKKKSGGKVQYRNIGGKVSGNDVIKMIYD